MFVCAWGAVFRVISVICMLENISLCRYCFLCWRCSLWTSPHGICVCTFLQNWNKLKSLSPCVCVYYIFWAWLVICTIVTLSVHFNTLYHVWIPSNPLLLKISCGNVQKPLQIPHCRVVIILHVHNLLLMEPCAAGPATLLIIV